MADEPVKFEDCDHPPEAIEDGPRVRGRWGTHPTQVCALCGGWRSTLAKPGPWWPGPVDRDDDDDDC